MTMATISISSHTQHDGNFLASVRDGALAFIEGIRQGREMAHNYRVLSHMSDDELRKRGLTRGDIGRAVVNGLAD